MINACIITRMTAGEKGRIFMRRGGFFARFFQGRNGMDFLGKVTWIATAVFLLLGMFTGFSLFTFLACIGLVFSVYRCFSRDLYSRQAENQKFLKFFQFQKMKFQQRKQCKMYRCKGCGRTVRIPKGKGKIVARCPVCGREKMLRT